MRLSAVALVVLLSPQVARAEKGIFHRVTDAGETYADIAAHYYGYRYLERHLRLFNRRPEPLREGTTIIIPTYELVPLKRNQAMHDFAAEHLSDPNRAEYLAELHGLKGRDRKLPRPGKRFKVVQSLKHVVRRGETLESIANLYYRDAGARRIRLLMLFNKLPNESIRDGAALRIPLDSNEFSRVTVALRARNAFTIRSAIAEVERPPPPPSSPPPPPPIGKRQVARRTPPPPPPPPAPKLNLLDELERAERLYGDGEYQACMSVVERAILI